MTKNISLQTLMIVSALLLFAASVGVAKAEEEETIAKAAHAYVGKIQVIQDSRFINKYDIPSNKGLFLKAKKAFHATRMDIQSIKKGDEDSRKGVPSFFDSEDSEEEDQENEDEIVASN